MAISAQKLMTSAIDDPMIDELNHAYAAVENSAEIWTLIITGNGRAFCVGADLNKASTPDTPDWAPGIDTRGEPALSSYRQWDAPQEATPPSTPATVGQLVAHVNEVEEQLTAAQTRLRSVNATSAQQVQRIASLETSIAETRS